LGIRRKTAKVQSGRTIVGGVVKDKKIQTVTIARNACYAMKKKRMIIFSEATGAMYTSMDSRRPRRKNDEISTN